MSIEPLPPSVCATSVRGESASFKEEFASLLPELIDFIKNKSMQEIAEDVQRTKPNISCYYNLARISLVLKDNHLQSEKILKVVSCIFPDQFVLYNATEILTDRVALPILRFCFSRGRYLLGEIIKRKYGFANAIRFQRFLADPLPTQAIYWIFYKTHLICSEYSVKKPFNFPFIGSAHKFSISLAQHVNVVSRDVAILLRRVLIWRAKKPEEKAIPVEKYQKAFLGDILKVAHGSYVQLHEDCVAKVRETKPKIVHSAIHAIIAVGIYFAIYFAVSARISQGVSFITARAASAFNPGIADEDLQSISKEVLRFLWHASMIPWILVKGYYMAPAIQLIHDGFRPDFNFKNTLFDDLGLSGILQLRSIPIRQTASNHAELNGKH